MKQSSTTNKSGLILLNKPVGKTSFQALGSIKRTLGTGKVGHTGTLDKFAEGLMIILTGKMTKLVPYVTTLDKEYVARLCFGQETDTLDPEGVVIKTMPIPDKETVKKAIIAFTGEIDQIPPRYSAIHINGKRAYQMVRDGEEFDIPSRKVTIFSIELLKVELPYIEIRVKCSKGTYIRSLARDIGVYCNSCAYLVGLKRTAVGTVSVSGSVSPDDFNEQRDLYNPLQITDFFDFLGAVEINPLYEELISVGKELRPEYFNQELKEGQATGVFDQQQKNLAFVKKTGDKISYLFVS